jgi:hypothetical protein
LWLVFVWTGVCVERGVCEDRCVAINPSCATVTRTRARAHTHTNKHTHTHTHTHTHRKAALGLQAYSLSMSTLEEVFLRLAEEEHKAGAAPAPPAPGEAAAGAPSAYPATVSAEQGEGGGKGAAEQGEGGGKGTGDGHEGAGSAGRAGPAPSASGPANGGGGDEEGGDDVWAELEEFECTKSTVRQVLAVLSGTLAAARRNPVTFILLVWNPVWMSTIVSLVFPLVKARPPSPDLMAPSALGNASLLVAIQPLPGTAGPVSDAVVARSLALLGAGFQGRVERVADAAALGLAMLASTAGNTSAAMSVLFEVDPVSGSGSVTLGYHKERMRSARLLVAQVLERDKAMHAAHIKPSASPRVIELSIIRDAGG